MVYVGIVKDDKLSFFFIGECFSAFYNSLKPIRSLTMVDVVISNSGICGSLIVPDSAILIFDLLGFRSFGFRPFGFSAFSNTAFESFGQKIRSFGIRPFITDPYVFETGMEALS